jgi:cellulose/xylan binding protein with CBM9 domain
MRRRQTVVISSLLVLLGASCVTLLGASCVSEKPSADPPGELAQFIVDKAPDKITPLNVNFDDKITLIGVEIDPPTEVAPGKRVKMTLYWRADKPLDDPDWKLFTHVLDSSGDRVMNVDNVGPLRQGGKDGQAWPPGRWTPGKVYVDSQTFNMPRKLKGSSIQIVAGIWKGRDRLPVRGGPSVADDRALVATLTTAAKPKPERSVPQLEVTRLPKGVTLKIEGSLDEAAWKDAADTSAFVDVRKGGADTSSSVQGSAKLLWDDKWLYVGATIKDDEVDGGFDKAEKDPHLWTKDCLEIMIDPDGDGDNVDYYEVQINPQNLVFDSRFDEYNKPRQEPNGPFGHQEWSAKLESAVKIDGTIDKDDDEDKGYVVEARIPWSSFDKAKAAPPKPGDNWRLNLYAMHDNSGVAWSPILAQGNFHKASRFGRIVWVDKKSEPLTLAAQGPERLPAAVAATATGKPEDPSSIVVQKKALQQLPAPPPVQPSPAVPPPPAKPAPATAPASTSAPTP